MVGRSYGGDEITTVRSPPPAPSHCGDADCGGGGGSEGSDVRWWQYAGTDSGSGWVGDAGGDGGPDTHLNEQCSSIVAYRHPPRPADRGKLFLRAHCYRLTAVRDSIL